MTILVSRRTSGSVLADPIPDAVWMSTLHIYSRRGDRVERWMHTSSTAGSTDCWAPLSGMERKSGTDAWAYDPVWCPDCFPGGRCGRRVVDSLGVNRRRCGQPAGLGDECRWHHDQDVAVDKALERAA